MINTIKIDSRQLRATFLPTGVWSLWTFFVLSILYALVANTSKPIDIIIGAVVLGLFALWLPVNRIVIDKRLGVITITSQRIFSKIVTIKQISELNTIDVHRGRGGRGVWFSSLNFHGENVLLIAPDILPNHVKKMLQHKDLIDQFIKYS